ncbi:Protein of unknown function, partial [Gryllus bimaculatus]
STCSRCARRTSCSSCTARSTAPCCSRRTSATWTAWSPSRRTPSCSASCCASTCCSSTATTTSSCTTAPTRKQHEHGAGDEPDAVRGERGERAAGGVRVRGGRGRVPVPPRHQR